MERECCLRCGGLFSGALEVDIYCCRDCKKLEFYAVEAPEEEEDSIAQVPCPYCGQLHEIDDPKCPHCGQRLLE